MLSAAVHRPQRLPAPGQCPPWQSVASCRPSAGDRKEGPDDASGGLSPPPAQGLLHVLNVCVCTIIHILSILQYNKTITDNNHKNEIQHYVIQYNVMYNVMHNIIQCNIIWYHTYIIIYNPISYHIMSKMHICLHLSPKWCHSFSSIRLQTFPTFV